MNHTTLHDYEVVGEIEVVEKPSPTLGFIDFMEDDSIRCMGTQIMVMEKTYNQLYKIFADAFSSDNGGMTLQIFLNQPTDSTVNFWKIDWKSSKIPISEVGFSVWKKSSSGQDLNQF
jgi:hypothetical protein